MTGSLGDLIRQASRADKGSDLRRTALETLIASSSTPSSNEDVLLIPSHLPELIREFPDLWPAAVNAAYDVSEHEEKDVRIRGYRLVVDLARMDAADEPGTMTDVLLQSLYTSHEDNSTEEIQALESCLRSLIGLHPGAAIGLMTSLLTAETNVPTKLIWDFVEGPAKDDIYAWMRKIGDEDAKQAVKENLFKVLEGGDIESRLSTIGLLLETNDPALLSRIVLSAATEPAESPQIKTFLVQIDRLLLSCPRLDYRWLLYLYCHSPVTVFEWAKLPAGQIPTAIASPSRLVEWVVASWNLWKEESQKGEVVADERLAIRELGVKMTKTAVAQVPTWFPGPITLVTIMPRIADLEACMLLSYFLFLKFKGQISDLVDGPLERMLKQIADVCERGLANAYGSDETSRARWANVAKMCQNMTPPIRLDTVHPSWTIPAKVVTPPLATLPTPPVARVLAPPVTETRPSVPLGNRQEPAQISIRRTTGPPISISSANSASIGSPSPSGFSIRDSARRPESPATSSRQEERRPSLIGRIAVEDEAAPKRKREPESRTPSLASRLGIQLPDNPKNEQDHRKKQRSEWSNNRRADDNPSRSSPAKRSEQQRAPDRKPIPNLLARMNTAGPPTPPSQPSSFPERPVTPSDGVKRRGRGFANAGIDLATPPAGAGGFTIRGRTPSGK